MAYPSALKTLIELTKEETDKAAQILGLAIKALEDAEKKLNMLHDYREEYAKKFRNNLSVGMTTMEFANFQQFIAKLDAAIQGQDQFVSEEKRRVDFRKKTWQECDQKKVSYDTLHTRAIAKAQHAASKREQKEMDEFAARNYFYKKDAK